jgi:hypothetical protein
MTDRKQTYEQYLNVCELHKKPKNEMITTVFESIVQIGPKVK